MLDPVMIMPYYSYGNDTCMYLKGRVLEREKIKEKKAAASRDTLKILIGYERALLVVLVVLKKKGLGSKTIFEHRQYTCNQL